MKRLVLTLAISLAFAFGGVAQNVWKPLNCSNYYLAVDTDGNLFAFDEYNHLVRSQDEGETWTQVLDVSMRGFMGISPEGRIFAFPSNNTACYSDDHGDTWQQTSAHPSAFYMKAYAVNADTLLLWGYDQLCYTLDAGTTWNTADMSFLNDEYHQDWRCDCQRGG